MFLRVKEFVVIAIWVDEEHFLTECPKYNVEREYLFNEANHHPFPYIM
jgi:hypothetical protein